MIKRKLEETGSFFYRNTFFRIKKVATETRTHSVIKQGAYWNKGTLLHGNNYVGKHVYLSNVDLGFGTTVNDGSRLANARIGKFGNVGPYVETALGAHPAHTFVATHPSFYSKEGQLGYTFRDETVFSEMKYIEGEPGVQVVIGNDIWLGSGVCILQGVTIGHGAIVGTGAVVTKDVPPYAIYAGIPAKKIGARFTEEQIAFLLRFRWWDKSVDWLKEHAAEFDNIESFMEKYA